MSRSALETDQFLLGKNDPLLDHHSVETGYLASDNPHSDVQDRYYFDAKAFGDIVANALGLVDKTWTIARAAKFLVERDIRSGWMVVNETVIAIERRTLLKLSPNLVALIATRTEVRAISVSFVSSDAVKSPKLRGAPAVLTLLIAISDNIEKLVEGEIARFIADSTVDISVEMASSAMTGVGIRIAAMATGKFLLPLAIGIAVGFIVQGAGEYLANRYRARQALQRLLRDVATEANENNDANARELERGSAMLRRALDDPMAAFQLIQSAFGGR